MSGRNVSDLVWLLAIIKAAVAVALAGVVVWSIVVGVAIDDVVLKVILVILAAYFGVSAVHYGARYWS